MEGSSSCLVILRVTGGFAICFPQLMKYAKFYVESNCQKTYQSLGNRNKLVNLTTKQHEIPATDRIIRFITIAFNEDLRHRINEGRLNKK